MASDMDANAVRRQLETVLGRPFLPGHTITRLRNGDQIFAEMVREMRAAQRSIDLLTFVYWTGAPAKAVASTLLDRAREGVRIRVVLDFFGARSMDTGVIDELKEAGVLIHWFRPLSLDADEREQIGNRTHRKICVVDETVAFVGGVGIAEEWDGDARSKEEWRDSHFRVTGPCVDTIRAGFLDDWATSEYALITDHDLFPDQDTSGSIRAAVVPGESEVGESGIAILKRSLLDLASHRIRMTTAYFSPDENMTSWLVDAADRGVDIQVMFPGTEIDKRLPQVAGEREFGGLLAAGIRLFSYDHSMLHAKILTIDGFIVNVGSANFNDRSIRQDEELDLVALDEDLAAVLDADFEADKRHCREITQDEWAKRGPLQRLEEQASRVIDKFV